MEAYTEFDNVKEVTVNDSDFYIEVSGEFLTEKLQPNEFKITHDTQE